MARARTDFVVALQQTTEYLDTVHQTAALNQGAFYATMENRKQELLQVLTNAGGLTVRDANAALSLLLTSKFTAIARRELAQAMTAAVGFNPAGAGIPRAAAQSSDAMELQHYLTKGIWDNLKTQTYAEKLALVANFLVIGLGFTNINEVSIVNAVAIIAIASCNGQFPPNLQAQDGLRMVRDLKENLRLARGTGRTYGRHCKMPCK